MLQLITSYPTMNRSELLNRCAVLPVMVLTCANAVAQPQLHCDITYAGTAHSYDARISNDSGVDAASDTNGAYLLDAADIGGRFRFKAILLGTSQRLDAVKVYAYYEGPRRPVLLQEVKFVAPFVYSNIPNSLTGYNHLYSPGLERELHYGCHLMEVK